jgi:rRNA biogenesis protein RRP5
MDGLEAFPRGSSGPGGIGGKGTRSSASSKGKRAASSTGTGTTASAAAAAVGAQDDAALLFGRGKRQKVGSSSHASRAGHSSGSAAFKMLEELGADLVTKGGASRPARVVPVTFKRLTRGSELLGVVQRVGPSDVVICLPGGLTGTVVASEISDSLYQAGLASSKGPRQSFTLDSVISAGQVVPCSVLGTTSGSGGKRITLTLRESVVNTGLTVEQLRAGAVVSGRITSVEDHGYLVNLGVPGVTAFLHRRDAGREELSNGQYVLATVKKGAAPGSALALVSSREVLLGICASAKGAFDVSSLKPGMKVEAKVEKVLCNGVLVSFLGFFMGVIDQDHMPCIGGEEEWKAEIGSVGTGLSARILAVNPITKTVHLTLRPHLIQLTAPDLPDEGKTIEGATVVRVDPKVGLLLKLPPSDEAPSDGGARTRSQGAYVHISRISDEHTDKVDKAFVVGHKVSCRIIGSSLVEGWSQAGIRPSLLNAQALKYSDVSPGQLINGVVMRSEGFGLLVSLSGGGGPSVRAVVNNMHLAEVSPPTAAAATRIKSGQRFKVSGAPESLPNIVA